MVHFSRSDIESISKFAFAWRLTDPRWDLLSEDRLKRIIPMGNDRSIELSNAARSIRHSGPYALRADAFHAVKSISLVEVKSEQCATIARWFQELPIGEAEHVYVNWARADPHAAIVTDWGTFTDIWDSLWYPFDVVDVFDDSMEWAVLLGPEEFAVYALRGPVDLPSPDNPGCAYGLVRTPTVGGNSIILAAPRLEHPHQIAVGSHIRAVKRHCLPQAAQSPTR